MAGNIYVVGYIAGGDAFIRKYDADGAELWTRQFSSTTEDVANGAGVDKAGSVYVVGHTKGALPDQTSLGSSDAFVVKISGGP